jgi:fatty acid-binding protein DegV
LAADTHGLTNVHLVDSRSAAAPIRHVAIKAREMADRGESVETILAFADRVFKDSVTYILPENIEQLVRGGCQRCGRSFDQSLESQIGFIDQL